MLKNRHFGVSLGLVIAATLAFGQSGIGPITSGVPSANSRSGHPDTIIARGFSLKTVAVGSDLLENPSGVITRSAFSTISRRKRSNRPRPSPTRTPIWCYDHNPEDPRPATTTVATFFTKATRIHGRRPTSPASIWTSTIRLIAMTF